MTRSPRKSVCAAALIHSVYKKFSRISDYYVSVFNKKLVKKPFNNYDIKSTNFKNMNNEDWSKLLDMYNCKLPQNSQRLESEKS